MLTLPRVKKGIRGASTGLQKVQRVIAGAALTFGLVLAVLPGSEARAAVSPPTPQVDVQQTSGALFLTPAGRTYTIVADHQSHSSHYSHQSHTSHYSSR